MACLLDGKASAVRLAIPASPSATCFMCQQIFGTKNYRRGILNISSGIKLSVRVDHLDNRPSSLISIFHSRLLPLLLAPRHYEQSFADTMHSTTPISIVLTLALSAFAYPATTVDQAPPSVPHLTHRAIVENRSEKQWQVTICLNSDNNNCLQQNHVPDDVCST
jgi:hypothetical protein